MKKKLLANKWVMPCILAALPWLGVMAVVSAASAQDAGQVTVVDGCMDDLFPGKLNCNANDIRLASASSIVITDPCEFPGDSVTFTATFEVELSAQARHDVGIYFDINADPEGDGALTGTCSVSSVHYTEEPDWVDLDGSTDDFVGTNVESGIQDTCGDIDDAHNPLYPAITITAVCSDQDGDGFLDLPYCTSWRQPGANELCTGPLPEADVGGAGLDSSGVVPGAPSKCKCDPGFNVAVPVPEASLEVTKSANPTTLDEPGAIVRFDVTVTNNGIDPNNAVTLTSLIDSIYGDLTTVQGDIVETTCTLVTIDPGAVNSYSCYFRANVIGNAGDTEVDTVVASGVDDNGNEVEGSDDATVNIIGIDPSIVLIKGNVDGNDNLGSVNEPGGSVVFDVSVENTSASSDPVTLTSLNDVPYGDITQVQGDVTATTCALVTIQPGDTYTCAFTANVNGGGGANQTDTLTANGVDDEGVSVTDSDQANVDIIDLAPTIALIKGAVDGDDNVGSVDEPGGSIVFNVSVENTSVASDAVTLTSLVDDVYGDITQVQGDVTATTCALVTIQPGDTYTCAFTANVSGNGGDVQVDIVTVSGADDEGGVASDSDPANVTINDIAPTAELIKQVTQMMVTYEVKVTNTSTVETLDLTVLSDDQFGDVTQVQGDIQSTNCTVPQELAVSGEANDNYTCSFVALVDSSPHTDEVTGTVSDDDGNTISPSDTATVTFD